MSDFQTLTSDVRALDPGKRVNYSFGLVLGVDEFLQEQTYFLARHRRHARALHGHGTVWGLRLSVSTTDPVEVRVEPGLAVTPDGHEVCVPSLMCARLDDWLAAHADALGDYVGTGVPLALCVVLCYRECATDVVPLPGDPCRADDDVMAPSRIADAFEIKLLLADGAGSPPGGLESCPPPSARLAGLRELTELLQRIHVTGSAIHYSHLSDIEAAVRQIAAVDPWVVGSPPTSPVYYVRPADARLTFNAVARVWATQVLPALLARDGGAGCAPAGDGCVLLGGLQFNVSVVGTVEGGAAAVVVDESERPILLATDALQEWALGLGPTEHVRVLKVPS